MPIHKNTARLMPTMAYVTGVSTLDEASFTRVATSGWAAFAQSRQCDPTDACTRHSLQAGFPQRVQ
jgi:hypothetical protein